MSLAQLFVWTLNRLRFYRELKTRRNLLRPFRWRVGREYCCYSSKMNIRAPHLWKRAQKVLIVLGTLKQFWVLWFMISKFTVLFFFQALARGYTATKKYRSYLCRNIQRKLLPEKRLTTYRIYWLLTIKSCPSYLRSTRKKWNFKFTVSIKLQFVHKVPTVRFNFVFYRSSNSNLHMCCCHTAARHSVSKFFCFGEFAMTSTVLS